MRKFLVPILAVALAVLVLPHSSQAWEQDESSKLTRSQRRVIADALRDGYISKAESASVKKALRKSSAARGKKKASIKNAKSRKAEHLYSGIEDLLAKQEKIIYRAFARGMITREEFAALTGEMFEVRKDAAKKFSKRKRISDKDRIKYQKRLRSQLEILKTKKPR